MAINSNAIPKNIKARTVLKMGTEEEWDKAQDFVPLKGEPIIWDILEKDSSGQYTTPRKIIARKMKVGDGQNKVVALPFVNVEKAPEITFEEYPVGFLFVSNDSTSPTDRGLKGTWTPIPAGSTIIGAGDGYFAGSTGGKATVTLTTDQMPSHSHQEMLSNGDWNFNAVYNKGGADKTNDGAAITDLNRSAKGGYAYVGYTGGGQPHDNMSPYIAYYMWIRIA